MPRRAPCGTPGAYQRHIRHREPVDPACQVARRLGRVIAISELCTCAECCCDQGGTHCRQRGCRICLDLATVIGEPPAPNRTSETALGRS